MNILIVDDSKIERMILKDFLETEGHNVEMSENGEEAMQSAFVSLPDLIISDILMPALDGFSLCRSIRADERTAHIPFVFYTATYVKDEDEAFGLKIGADGFFRKSMEWDQFYPAVMSLVYDIEKSGRVLKQVPDQEDGDLYKLYNERLIKKLEDKVFELEKEVRWRKKVEAQLYESRQFLELAIEGADIGIWDWNTATGDCRFTGKWVENLGYNPDDIVPRFETWVNLLHPDDRDKTLESVQTSLSGQNLFSENEYRLLDASGNWRWVLSRGKVVERDAKGNPLRQAGTFMEITERKRMEEALKKSREDLRELSKHLQSAIESERMKIARDIHDELGQVLTAVKYNMAWLNDQISSLPEPVTEKAGAAISLIDNAIQSVKRIVTDLRPGVLDDLGLAAAIEWQAGVFEKLTGVPHRVDIDLEDIQIGSELGTALFRFCQEAMTNASKHAKASRVLVACGLKNGILEILIEDNGVGIDKDKISAPRSFGLTGMRERIIAFGGSIDFSGGINGGTRVMAKIPINEVAFKNGNH